MNPNLYTDEFRAFKYLKSTKEQVEYFKNINKSASRIRPWDDESGTNFFWPHRLEFVEQLLDLRNDTVYIVSSGTMSKYNIWEYSYLIELENPIILDKNPLVYAGAKDCGPEDIFELEQIPSQYCLVSANSFTETPQGRIFNTTHGDNKIFNMNSFHIIPDPISDFTELFYDKDTAMKYQKSLTEFIRKTNDAISTFGRAL